jgi:hypothetical protein
MRKVIAAIAALAVLAVPVTASAGNPTPSRAQFNALKSQVSSLQKRVSAAESNLADLNWYSAYNECNDAFQWDILQAIIVAMGAEPGGTAYDDNGACAAIGIDRNAKSARSTASAGNGLFVPAPPSSDQQQAMVRGIIARIAG